VELFVSSLAASRQRYAPLSLLTGRRQSSDLTHYAAGVRTGKYSITLDQYPLDENGVHLGIYNEDMAVAIVDEVEQNKLNHKHWCPSGEIGLGKW
jgi:hypothetical protein